MERRWDVNRFEILPHALFGTIASQGSLLVLDVSKQKPLLISNPTISIVVLIASAVLGFAVCAW